MQSKLASRIGWRMSATIGLLAVSLLLYQQQARPAASAAAQVERAWTNVRLSDQYAFSADVVITTIPLPTVGNIGRFSKTDSLYLEGTNDPRGKNLELALWGGGVSAANRDAAYQVRVKDGRTEIRAGDEAWRSSDSSAVGFAPEGDFLAYLDMAKNVALAPGGACAAASSTAEHAESAERAQKTSAASAPSAVKPASTAALDCDQFTVYTFDLDSRAYAERLRSISEQQLIRSGMLPPGATAQLPAHLTQISGTGELWVDARGLPVRQKVAMSIPAAAGADYRTETVMDIRYSDYRGDGAQLASVPWLGSLVGRIARANLPAAPEAAAGMGIFGMALAGAVVVARTGRRTRFVVTVVALVAMLVTPTLQTNAATVAVGRLNAAQAEQAAAEQAQSVQKATSEIQNALRASGPYTPPAEVLAALAEAQSGAVSS